MNANNKSPATSATKSALLVETTGTRSTNDKFGQKVGSFPNQNNGESSEDASAKKEALAKQITKDTDSPLFSHFIREARTPSHFAICATTRSSLHPPPPPTTTKINAHTRFALPVNTHGNLKYLHGKAQENADVNTADADKSDVALTATKQRRDSSSAKFSQKMKPVFPDKRIERKQDDVEKDSKKSAFYRQFIEARALMNPGIRR